MIALALLLLLSGPLQQDCRGPGSIGIALMSPDGTISLNIRQPQPGSPIAGVAAVRPGDPLYARILSHVGGLTPGQRKPVPPFC